MPLQRCDEQFIIARSGKVPLVLGACVVAVGLYLLSQAINALQETGEASLIYAGIAAFIGIAFCTVGYRLSSPYWLSFDRTRRTYEGARGWFPFREQWAGSWSDFDRLSVERVRMRNNETWMVALQWRDSSAAPFPLYWATEKLVGVEEAKRRGVVLPERWDETQRAAVEASPLRFFVDDKELRAQHQALILSSLLDIPIEGDPAPTPRPKSLVDAPQSTSAYAIESALLQPAPRPVRLKPGRRRALSAKLVIVVAALVLTGVALTAPASVAVVTGVFLLLMVWGISIRPRRRRDLVMNGRPIEGRIVSTMNPVAQKATLRGDQTAPSCMFQYEYAPTDVTSNGTPFPIRGWMDVQNEKDWREVQIGDAVTILYDPRRPKRSLIYRFAEYEVVTAS